MALITLVALGGGAVVVNTDQVVSLKALPAALLLAPVTDGTRIVLSTGADEQATAYEDVQGTVAATIAALGGSGAAAVLAFGLVDGAGALLSGFGIASAARNGPGDYTVVFNGPLPANAQPMVTPGQTDRLPSNNGPLVGLNQNVLVTDLASPAAAPTDGGFFILLVGTV